MTFPSIRRTFTATTLVAGLFAISLTGCKKDAPVEAPAPVETPAAMGNTVADVAMADAQFTTLVSLIQAAGIADNLKAAGPITVFAPTNAAFAALPVGTVDTLMLEKNKQKLTDILLFHVVNGNIKAADLKGMSTVTTNAGNAPLAVTVDGETVKVGDATVTSADVAASNGTIHVIDRVLMPPSAM